MTSEARQTMAASATVLALMAAATPASAALPPYWQSAREISTILNDPRVHDALKYEEPIVSITATGDDIYVLTTERCSLTITIVDVPQDKPIAGPRQFDIEVGQADCQ